MKTEPSGDELFLFVVASLICAIGWGWWYQSLSRMNPFSRSSPERIPLHLAPPICMLLWWYVLRNFAAREVRHSIWYVSLFLVVGGAWLQFARVGFSFLGVSVREDAFENRNSAAVAAISGAMLGVALAYA